MRMPIPVPPTSTHSSFQRIAVLILTLTLSIVLIGCGDDSTEPGNLPADFSGSWTVSGEVISKRVCDNEVGTTRSWDVVITQEGNIATFTFDGGSSTELTVVGSTATGEKINGEHLVFALTIANDELGGTITALNTELPCEEVWSVVGTRVIGSGTGAFAGFWNIEGEFVTNGCGFAIGPDCNQFAQDGNMVTIVGEDLEGTVVGNTLTIHEEIVFESVTLSFDAVIQISNDGDSWAGTNTLSTVDELNPENNCTSVANVTGTRTDACSPVGSDLGMIGVALYR